MIYRKFSASVFTLCACLSFAYGQRASTEFATQDSIRLFTDSVLTLVEERSLYTDQLDWAAYRPAFTKKVLNETRFSDILPHFVSLWDTLGDHHSGIGYADEWYSAPGGLDTTSMSKNLVRALKKSDTWAVQTAILSDKYGYVVVPTINTQDDSLATQRAADALQDSVCRVAQSKVDGWIVDLRRNLGGNMYAMLGGIHQLAGKGTFSYLLNKSDSVYSYWGIDSTSVHEGENGQVALPQPCTLPDSFFKVAVLVGPLTASSGEITALAFLGKKNVTVIGEPSAGYMTGNEFYRLPFDAHLTLAEAYETDRHKIKMTRIEPDILVEKGDNFDDPYLDAKIQAALKWLKAAKP